MLRLSVLLLALHEPAQSAATYFQMTTQANKTAINTYNQAMARAMAALAKLAYCGTGPSQMVPYGTSSGVQGATRKSCGGFCTNAGFSLGKVMLVEANDGGQQNADFAYVAKLRPAGNKTAPADCVVAIRGTWVSPANADRNQETDLVDWDTPSCKGKGCKVHSGANAIWSAIKGDIVDSLKSLKCQSVVVTGHSLGAQLSTLAMFSLQDEFGYKVELSYTFEGPIPFNRAATAVFDGGLFPREISLFRITTTSDKVVMFPQEEGYLQPGSQVWFYGPRAHDFVHCGSNAQAPKCGVNGVPSNTLCSMKSNPSWKKCGGAAPYGGPHCTNPIAPAGSFCNMAGANMAGFSGANIFTCHLGNSMYANAQQPTVPPQVFPVEAPPKATTTLAPLGIFPLKDQVERGTEAKPTVAKPTGTATANEFAGESFDSSLPPCWSQNTAYVPLGMLGKVAVIKPTPLSCQQYCAATPFCEYVSWWSLRDGSGLCHVSGGWAHQMSMAGAMSGPKNCSVPTAEESNIQRAINMEIMFLQSLSGGGSPSPFVRFNERWHEAVPGNFSSGSFVAFGMSMLVLGASFTLLLTRARFGGSRRGTREVSSSVHLTAEDGAE